MVIKTQRLQMKTTGHREQREADPSGLVTTLGTRGGGTIKATAAWVDQPTAVRNGERSGSRWTSGTTSGSLS